MTPRLALLASLAVFALAPAAQAANGVKGGTITPNRGVNGANLGMTRAQVIDRLGDPVSEYLRILSYGYRKYEDTLSIYRAKHADRVEYFQMGLHGRHFKLPGGNHPFVRGGVGRLRDDYGKRLHKAVKHTRPTERSYTLYGRLKDRPVATKFLVSGFKRSDHVYEITMFFRD